MSKILVMAAILAVVIPAARLQAQEAQAPSGAGSSSEESNSDRKPSLDPFRVLIKPEAPPAPVIQPTVQAAPAPPPPPPPLQFSVKAIAGEAPHYVAVLNYQGNDYIAEEGWESEDHAFTVKRIGPNKAGQIEVEVYNKKTNRLAHKAYMEPKIPGFESSGEGGPPAGGGAAPAGGDLGGGADGLGGALGGDTGGGGATPPGGGDLGGAGPPPQ